jgi:hypothetical protein
MNRITFINWNDPDFKLNPRLNEDNIIEKLLHNENIKKAFLEYCAQRKKEESEEANKKNK